MSGDYDPIIGGWYRPVSKGLEFEVVALDEFAGTVEIQSFDGQIDELDIDTWYQLELVEGNEPENWIGAIDIEEWDDLGTSITDTSPFDWVSPLLEHSPEESKADNDDTEEEESLTDEWGLSPMEEESSIEAML